MASEIENNNFVNSSDFLVTSTNDEKRGCIEIIYDDKFYQANLDPIFFSRYKPVTMKGLEFLLSKPKRFEFKLENGIFTVNIPYELNMQNEIFYNENMELRLSQVDDNNLKTTFVLTKRIRELENKLSSVEKEKSSYRYSYSAQRSPVRESATSEIKEPKSKQKNEKEEKIMDEILIEGVQFVTDQLREQLRKRNTRTGSNLYDFFSYY